MQGMIKEIMEADNSGERPAISYTLAPQSSLLKNKHYQIAAFELDESGTRRIFDSETEQAISHWFAGPGKNRFDPSSLDAISIDEDVVSLHMQSRLVDVSAIEEFINLGLLIARKTRSVNST